MDAFHQHFQRPRPDCDAVNSVHYVDTINGLNIDISAGSLPKAEAATTFLRRADLMN